MRIMIEKDGVKIDEQDFNILENIENYYLQ